MKTSIVSVEWLHENLEDANLIILDASLKSNEATLSASNEPLQIAGARYMDLKNAFGDSNSKYPNTLLSSEAFEKQCQKLGVNNSSKIVVYDNNGLYSSPRAWWMFRIMGHKNIAVLDGGLPAWIEKGYLTETRPINKTFEVGDFKASCDCTQVKNFEFVKQNIKTKEAIVIDARSANRFNSRVPEPREGLRSGNIPNSVNLPYQDVQDNGKLKSKEELKKIFSSLELGDKPLVFSCGSGVTACVILLAGQLVLDNDMAVYDGSWIEWAQREE